MLSVLVWASVSAAHAEIRESLSYQYYAVVFAPGMRVNKALDEASPIREGGKLFYARTQWKVRWYYHWWQESDGRCRITDNTTTVSGEILLPRIQGILGRLESPYAHAFAALKEHELGHFQIGRGVAEEVDHFILALAQAVDCTALAKAADQGALRIIEQAKHRDAEYDQRTGNGRTQGAVFDF